MMIPMTADVKVWLATGHTDMRRGFPGLALQVQEVLRRDPMSGHLFVFRGRRGDLLKVIWHDGQGACLFVKRLEREVPLAVGGRRRGDDQRRSVGLSARRDRLAEPAEDVAPEPRRMMENPAGTRDKRWSSRCIHD